jgi:hypothetical protein
VRLFASECECVCVCVCAFVHVNLCARLWIIYVICPTFILYCLWLVMCKHLSVDEEFVQI